MQNTTLGELLCSTNKTVYRHAQGIKKELQNKRIRMCGACATNPKYKDLYTECEHYKGD